MRRVGCGGPEAVTDGRADARSDPGDLPGVSMKRVTVNLTAEGNAALQRLPGRDRTDALNRALRLADSMRRYMVDGVLVVRDVDGRPVRIHIT